MNRKLLALSLSLAFAAMLYAQDSTSIKVTGFLIDNACADSAKGELSTRAKGHSVSCALMDNCEKSGYSVVTEDNTRYKLSARHRQANAHPHVHEASPVFPSRNSVFL